MKMSDIVFLKTELNRSDLIIQKPKTQFLQFSAVDRTEPKKPKRQFIL